MDDNIKLIPSFHLRWNAEGPADAISCQPHPYNSFGDEHYYTLQQWWHQKDDFKKGEWREIEWNNYYDWDGPAPPTE